jgi:hypothetical protein
VGPLRADDDLQGMFNTALNADSRLWRAGCWSRAALLAGMWVTLAWAPAVELPRAFAQLLIATAGLLLGFASIIPGGRELVAKVPGTAVLVNHFGTFRRAAVDAPALAEGFGALLAGLLYAGWFPLAGLPVSVRSLGLAMAVCYGWETVLQAVIHPGWYNRDALPARAMHLFRYIIPAVFAGFIMFVLLPWNAADTQVPLVVRILLSVFAAGLLPAVGGIRHHAQSVRDLAAELGDPVALGRLGRRALLSEERARVPEPVCRGTRP